MNKFSELINSFRIFPRIALGVFLYLLIDLQIWIKGLEDLSTSQGVYAGAVWAACAAFFNFYATTGGSNARQK